MIISKMKIPMIHSTTKQNNVVNNLSDYVINRDVFKELGEPILFDKGDIWFFYKKQKQAVGFCCVLPQKTSMKLKYIYVHPDHRKNGIFKELMNVAEEDAKEKGFDKITAVATNQAYPLYKKRGYETSKSWTNYHNVFKTL